MDTNLPSLYKDYGQYSNWRNLPLDIDGLKPVERRVLYSAYKIARNGFVKSRQVDAYTIGHYHPHGNCYGTIVQMVRQGILVGQGNFGANIGVEPVGPAADRYTECRMGQSTVDFMFKYIKHVPFIGTELGDTEPEFLPTILPICLVGKEYTIGIGFGHKTFIPCYEIKDLYQRLLWLLGIRKRKPIIKPITDCTITSSPEVLDQLLTTGQAKLEVEGVIAVNQIRNELILKSWPPGRKFEAFLNKFSKELNENMIGFSDLSKTTTEILFQVLRERNRDKIFQDFVDKMKESIKGAISFETTVVDINKKVIVKSIDNMLLDTYKIFTVANKQMLEHEILSTEKIIDEYKMLDKIIPHLTVCIQQKKDFDEALIFISTKTSISIDIIKELTDKYKIKKILTLNTDTTDFINKKKELEETYKNLEQFVLDQYNKLT